MMRSASTKPIGRRALGARRRRAVQVLEAVVAVTILGVLIACISQITIGLTRHVARQQARLRAETTAANLLEFAAAREPQPHGENGLDAVSAEYFETLEEQDPPEVRWETESQDESTIWWTVSVAWSDAQPPVRLSVLRRLDTPATEAP